MSQLIKERNAVISNFRLRINVQSKRLLHEKEGELDALIVGFIELLKEAKTTAEIQGLCDKEIALLEEGYPPNTVSRTKLGQYRKAVQVAYEDGLFGDSSGVAITRDDMKKGEIVTSRRHRAYDMLKYPPEFYVKQRQESAGINNLQQDNKRPIKGEVVIAKAVLYLYDEDPWKRAAALAVLTGRRVTEIVIKGEFIETAHPYAVAFKGQQKKKKDVESFIIPTLIPGKDIIEAIKSFRMHPEVAVLADQDYKAVQGSVGAKINRRVDQMFGELIPIIEGRKSVSVHSLRGVYAALCCLWLKPYEQGDMRFLEAILGHVTGKELDRQANSRATEHYDRYYVIDRSGVPLAPDNSIITEHGPIPVGLCPETLETPVENTDVKEPTEATTEVVEPAPASGTDNSEPVTKGELLELLQQFQAAQVPETTDTSLQAKLEAAQAQIRALEAQCAALQAQNEALTQRLEQAANLLSPGGTVAPLPVADTPTEETPNDEIKTPKAKNRGQVTTSDAYLRLEKIFTLFQLYALSAEGKPDITQTMLNQGVGASRPAVKAWMDGNESKLAAYRAQYSIFGRHNRKNAIDIDQVSESIRELEDQCEWIKLDQETSEKDVVCLQFEENILTKAIKCNIKIKGNELTVAHLKTEKAKSFSVSMENIDEGTTVIVGKQSLQFIRINP